MWDYSEKVREHFLNPRNMGTIDNPGYHTIVKSEICNDIVKLMANIDRDGLVQDIKAQVFGCGYSIAGASILTETAKGENAQRVLELMLEEQSEFTEGIPKRHHSCVELASEAFKKILEKYNEK